MITVLAPPPSPSAPLAADLHRIGETADRFDRPRLIDITVARFAASDAVTRARDAAITRIVTAVTMPPIVFGLGFLSSFAL